MPLKNKNFPDAMLFIYKIIQQNNIKFGYSQNLTNKRANLFIMNKRYNVEFFDMIYLKNILYKIYLYIKTLYQINNKKTNNFLFATTTVIYSEIIKNAATSAFMPFHTERWICGTISKGVNHMEQGDINNNRFLFKRKNIYNFFFNFYKYKKIYKNPYFSNNLVGIFIPDVQNNLMIIKEAQIENIPLFGIINTNCKVEIHYPIFGNNSSMFAIFFFSNLLSYWIKNYIKIYGERKSYSLKRKVKNNKKKIFNKYEKKIYYKFFKKRYINMIYYFSKRFQKNIIIEDILSTLGFKDIEYNVSNYQKKWFLQKSQRFNENSLLFSLKNFWSLTSYEMELNQMIRNNWSGELSWANRLWGKSFWLIFRSFLINKEKKNKKRYIISKNYQWFKPAYSIKKKFRKPYRKWKKYEKRKIIKRK